MSEKKNARLVDWRLTVAVWVVGADRALDLPERTDFEMGLLCEQAPACRQHQTEE